MFAMISYVLKYVLKYITEIKLTFFLPGHTYMPVDSIHATIETFIKKKTVWAPSEWPPLIRNARTNPRPLEVIELKSTDFMDWKQFCTSVFPNILKTVSGEKIMSSKLKSLLFTKKGDDVDVLLFQSYKYEEYPKKLQVIKKSGRYLKPTSPKTCYDGKLPILAAKFKDLSDLCKNGKIPEK